ncbi:hypothetical protein, partial [Burkholderia sp. Bp8963]|uniref:hypothetical protein n=1 Tax=Burkholderia sp. Bp8963 TaxID=2184547 RepID=UPI001C898EA9
QRSQFLSFFIRQLHWRCMSASAHPDMITEAVIYSIYLRDVVLGRTEIRSRRLSRAGHPSGLRS